MVIHFICRGNNLRSLIAETYLKSLELPNVTTLSSGTITDAFRDSDRPYFERTARLLTEHGIGKYMKPESEQLTQERMANNDVVVLVNERVVDEARSIVTLPKDIIVWDITDIGEGSRTAAGENGRPTEEVVFDEVVARVDELVKTLH